MYINFACRHFPLVNTYIHFNKYRLSLDFYEEAESIQEQEAASNWTEAVLDWTSFVQMIKTVRAHWAILICHANDVVY